MVPFLPLNPRRSSLSGGGGGGDRCEATGLGGSEDIFAQWFKTKTLRGLIEKVCEKIGGGETEASDGETRGGESLRV